METGYEGQRKSQHRPYPTLSHLTPAPPCPTSPLPPPLPEENASKEASGPILILTWPTSGVALITKLGLVEATCSQSGIQETSPALLSYHLCS